MVTLEPMAVVLLDSDGCVALGIVLSDIEPLAEAVLIYVPFQVMANARLKMKLIDFVPSALCEMVVVPLAIVLLPLPPIVVVPLFTVEPLIVME